MASAHPVWTLRPTHSGQPGLNRRNAWGLHRSAQPAFQEVWAHLQGQCYTQTAWSLAPKPTELACTGVYRNTPDFAHVAQMHLGGYPAVIVSDPDEMRKVAAQSNMRPFSSWLVGGVVSYDALHAPARSGIHHSLSLTS